MSSISLNRNKALAATAAAVFLWLIATLIHRHHAPAIFQKHTASPYSSASSDSSASSSSPSSSPNATRLSGQEAEDHCQRYRLPALDPSAPPRKIFDLLLANSELEMLELRLGELYPHVDYFVILESNVTFTGHPKPLYIQENYGLFSAFHDKMVVRTVDMSGLKEDPTAWDREHLSRNAMLEQVVPFLEGPQKAELGDVLLLSDVDEIPKPDALAALRGCDVPERVTMNSDFYYYSFQWLSREEWAQPRATVYSGADTPRLEEVRTGRKGHVLKHAAWHCSYCFGTLGEAVAKVNSFSHQEFNKWEFKDPAKILERVRFGTDFFDRDDHVYDYRAGNPDVPSYLLDNADRFGFMLDRNAANANFRDVPTDGNVEGLEFE